MQLREYRTSDCAELAELFYQTVHSVNAKDYSKEQLDAWATGTVDTEGWNRSFLKNHTVVATENDEIIGFGDIDDYGYLDMLYVHKNHQRKGVASAICSELERFAEGMRITTHASVTAKRFFEQRGYRTIKEQTVIRHGVSLTNFVMEKQVRHLP